MHAASSLVDGRSSRVETGGEASRWCTSDDGVVWSLVVLRGHAAGSVVSSVEIGGWRETQTADRVTAVRGLACGCVCDAVERET